MSIKIDVCSILLLVNFHKINLITIAKLLHSKVVLVYYHSILFSLTPMSVEVFELHVQQALEKLEDLWLRSNAIPKPESELWQNSPNPYQQQQQKLLQESLDQLSASIEELRVASETLRQQNEELLASRQQISAERAYYLELFDRAPDCYIVTTKDGTVKEANEKTAQLLGVPSKYLIRKALAVFVSSSDRQEYYTKLNQVKKGEISEISWQLKIVTRTEQIIPVECTLTAMRDRLGKITNLRWRISPIEIEPKQQVNSDLNRILIGKLRYPLYDLATEIAEIQTERIVQPNLVRSDRRWQRMSKQVASLKNTVNNAYIYEYLTECSNINLSLIDYTVFIGKIVQEVQQYKNLKPRIVEDYQKCVGVCDVLLLKQIIINLLSKSIEYTTVDSQIQIQLTKDSSTYFTIQIKSLTGKTTTEDLITAFSPLVSSNDIQLVSDHELTLAAIKKCVNLLKGEINLAAINNKVNLTIKLPIILRKDKN